LSSGRSFPRCGLAAAGRAAGSGHLRDVGKMQQMWENDWQIPRKMMKHGDL